MKQTLSYVLLTLSVSLSGSPITLRLLRADQAGALVSTAVTQIDLGAEAARLQADAEAAAAKAALAGKDLQIKDLEPEPQARFDRYTNYMRGVIVDGKHPFQLRYRGSYLGRADVITLELEDGNHWIDPGHHEFNVADGKVTTSDPHLRADGATLDITMYPVTVIAVNGSAVRALPAEVRRLPIAPRLYWQEQMLLPKEKLLAEEATFERLTLYLMANETAASYRVQPGGCHFKVGAGGIELVDEYGQPTRDLGAYVEGSNTLVLPRFAVPITLRGRNIQVAVSGASGNLKLTASASGEAVTKPFYAFSAPADSQVVFGNRAASSPVPFPGDLGEYPRRRILVDNSLPTTAEPRLLAVALPAYTVAAGGRLPVRVQYRDAMDAPTLLPPQVKAFVSRDSVLADDGGLRAMPPVTSPAAAWQSLRPRATSDPEQFEVDVPNLPGGVYVLRVVVDQRGACTPSSTLQADFIIGIDDATGASLSVYCGQARHGFLCGKPLPFSVVLKTTRPMPAAKLAVHLQQGGSRLVLVERDLDQALAPGSHAYHFAIPSEVSAALAEGTATLTATLGELRSNAWTVQLHQPKFADCFPYYDDGWGTFSNINAGVTYYTSPHDLAEAAAGRETIVRNAQVHARQTNLNVTNWSGFFSLDCYQGRDSSSEVAQVESILRRGRGLPAHEMYYHGSFFERSMEGLLSQGLGEFNTLYQPFSPRSLIHSTPSEVQAMMRQYQLTAQIAARFDNFLGMTLVKDDTVTTGDSEVGDSGRAQRLRIQMAEFVARHGFKPPSATDANEVLRAAEHGSLPPALAEVATRWEAWAEDENKLRADYYGLARQLVEPLLPGLRYGEQGPCWGGTETGDYPPTALAQATTLLVQSGCGDFGMQLVLNPLLRTRFFQSVGADCWGTLGFNGNHGFYQLKTHLAGYLAAGARGFGYYSGMRKEAENPRYFLYSAYAEERQDIRDLLNVYGNMFRCFEPKADIAVFYPFHQSMYDYVGFELVKNRGNGKDAVYSAMAQLAFLGYNSEVLTEEHIDAGALSRFKIVILPVLTYALPRHLQALESYAAAGGVLLAGSNSTLLPAGATRLADDFKEMHRVNETWGFNAMNDDGTAFLFSEMKRKLPVLKEALTPILQPFAQAETDRVLVQTSRAGDGRLTFVWSYLYPSFMGTDRVNNARWSMPRAEANETVFLPLREWLRLPPDQHTFELYGTTAVDVEDAGNRVRTLVDLSHTPVRFLLTLPAPVAGLTMSAPDTAALGTTMALTVTPVDDQGQSINAPVPLQVRLTDASGALIAERFPASFPNAEMHLSLPLAAAAGVWQLTVKELAGGLSFKQSIKVITAPPTELADAVTELGQVDVQRGAALQQFLNDRRSDREPVWILLGEQQMSTRREAAEALQTTLAALGVASEIHADRDDGVVSPRERVHLYKNWSEMRPAQFIEHHVALLGCEGESALFEELQESQLLLRSLTANYPGAGRGILGLVRSPFAYGRDALVCVGPDAAGIAAAIHGLSALATGAPPKAPAAAAPRPSRQLQGVAEPGTAFATMDGDPVQVMTVRATDGRVAAGTLGYGRNLFVFDRAGKLLAEDKIGHVNTAALVFGAAVDEVLITSDGRSYRRAADGSVAWQLRANVEFDPRGRYIVRHDSGRIAVLGPALQTRWQLDEWDQFNSAEEILFGRKPQLLGFANDGDQLIIRLQGKAPGLTGRDGDVVEWRQAASGETVHGIDFDLPGCMAFAGIDTDAKDSLRVMRDGAYFILDLETRKATRSVLLNAELQPLQVDAFTIPPYVGNLRVRVGDVLLADRRLAFTCGDSLQLTDADWRDLRSVRTRNLILSMVVDEGRERIAVSNYSGDLIVYDYDLRPLWQRDTDAAAHLALRADGSLLAGSLRGKLFSFAADGRLEWQADLNRYEDPAWVEQRWRELEALPTMQNDLDNGGTLAERIERQAALGADTCALSGDVTAGHGLRAELAAESFATYVMSWETEGLSGSGAMTLEMIEREGKTQSQPARDLQRLTLTASPGAGRSLQERIVRVGPRPERVNVRIDSGGNLTARTRVSLRPIVFPSADLIRVEGLYDGHGRASDLSQMPAVVELFRSKALGGRDRGHITRWADPYAMINGRLFDTEPRLLGGKWFGDGNFFMNNYWAEVPCFISVELPQKEVLTHIVITEDPALERLAAFSVEAYIEAYNTRTDLTALEQRQVKRGFWQQLVKVRDSSATYHVYRFEPPVFSRNVRVHLLSGYPAVTEVELYGGMAAVKQIEDAREHQP